MIEEVAIARIVLEETRKFFKEKEDTLQYMVYVALKSEPDTTIGGLIEDRIKAIPGVTVVDTRKDISTDYFGNKTHFVKVKFLSKETLTKPFVKYLKNKILTFTDKQGDRILAVKVTVAPKVVKSYESDEEKSEN